MTKHVKFLRKAEMIGRATPTEHESKYSLT